MKPIQLTMSPSAYFINKVDPGSKGPGSITGKVTKGSDVFSESFVCLFLKQNFIPIVSKKTKEDGSYGFHGLNKNQKYFLIAFDPSNQYNPSIQDVIIPK